MFGMDMDHGHGMEMDDDMMMAMLSCNGMDVGELTAMGGGFRIFNNVVSSQGDDEETTATMETDFILNAGTEADMGDLGIGRSRPAGTATDPNGFCCSSRWPSPR